MALNLKYLDSLHRIKCTTNIIKVLIWKATYLAALEDDLKDRYQNILANLSGWEETKQSTTKQSTVKAQSWTLKTRQSYRLTRIRHIIGTIQNAISKMPYATKA